MAAFRVIARVACVHHVCVCLRIMCLCVFAHHVCVRVCVCTMRSTDFQKHVKDQNWAFSGHVCRHLISAHQSANMTTSTIITIFPQDPAESQGQREGHLSIWAEVGRCWVIFDVKFPWAFGKLGWSCVAAQVLSEEPSAFLGVPVGDLASGTLRSKGG